MTKKYGTKIKGKHASAIVSPGMLQAGAKVLANRGSMSPHDLVAAIYSAMHEAAPRAQSADALTPTMHQALAILGKRSEERA